MSRVIALVLSMVVACGGSNPGSPDAAPHDAITSFETNDPVELLTISPLTQDFGSVNVVNHGELTFTVTNAGQETTGTLSAQIAGADADDFTVTSTTCTALAAAASCSVVVDFSPGVPLGQKTAALAVSGTPGGKAIASLDGVAVSFPSLTITPDLTFGPTSIGAVSAAGTMTLSNTSDVATGLLATQLAGAEPSQFTIVSDACNDTELQPSATCAIVLAFAPTAAAPSGDSMSVTVSASPGGVASANATGTVIQPPAELSITPSPSDFGSVAPGCPAGSTQFVVTNGGGETSGVLAAALAGADAANFVIIADACTGISLAAAASCTITASFAPQAVGSEAATLAVTATPGGTANATLLGNGISSGGMTIVVASPFPDTPVGQRSSAQTLTVTSFGCLPTGALFTALGGADPSQFTIVSDQCRGVSLAGDGQCTVTLAFAPTVATPSAKSANFTVSGVPGGTVTSGLAGNALPALPAALAIAPPSFDFGDVAAGTATQTTLTVTNTGAASSGALSTTSAGASDFSTLADGCSGVSLATGDSCTVTVELAPITTGTKSTTLTIASSATSTNATITGDAVADGAFLAITGSEQFADTIVGQSSATKTITVSNVGTVAIGVLVDTLDPAQFTVIADTCAGFVLDVATDCVVVVAFTPTDASPPLKQATFELAGSPGGIASTGLSGTADL